MLSDFSRFEGSGCGIRKRGKVSRKAGRPPGKGVGGEYGSRLSRVGEEGECGSQVGVGRDCGWSRSEKCG